LRFLSFLLLAFLLLRLLFLLCRHIPLPLVIK
jgi:hypothetical protein